ncbi:MAG: hypothetical protein OZSIB_3989 [Candidatus Ozemobacter sibiricus]|uniref:DUF3089 domain-containing protein n=1 Tax=Candidatus Ozemobacter sibiricus TaxID=2268124 RepID=A0A367ZNY5_9BACT|nr:MAG: hypothetical protein OZSIB_3989 [Candidatus Ozemobacter sibiricus]
MLLLVGAPWACGVEVASRPVPAAPDYAREEHWAALPWKVDGADFLPAGGDGLADGQATAAVDTFFIHPTTCLDEEVRNAGLDEPTVNLLTDRGALRFQASAFNGATRVFAPRYRQASLGAFLDRSGAGRAALDQAYEDIRAAFRHYLARFRQGRPFVIAGHSQGTALAIRLLNEFVVGQPLAQDLVAAWLPGQYVGRDSFDGLPFLRRPDETGGFVAWATVAPGAGPHLVCGWTADERFPPFTVNTAFPLAINPLTWDADRPAVASFPNPGALPDVSPDLPEPGPLVRDLFDAQVVDGLVEVAMPRASWYEEQFNAEAGDFHLGDIPLFWMSLRNNVACRVGAFLKKRAPGHRLPEAWVRPGAR